MTLIADAPPHEKWDSLLAAERHKLAHLGFPSEQPHKGLEIAEPL